MSQATPQTVAAGLSGTAFRGQLNAILAALYTQNSGNTAPSPTAAGMMWLDTNASPAVLKLRNAADSGWITVLSETVAAKTVRGNSSASAAAEAPITMSTLATMLGFGSSVADPGWITLPGGLILQWGSTAAIAAGGGQTVTFPIVFPAACFQIYPTPITVANNTSGFTIGARAKSTSGFIATNNSGTSGPVSASWFAVGN